MDDIDFKAKVTRAEFEHLCADLFQRVPQPVKDALSAAEMTMVSPAHAHLCLSVVFYLCVLGLLCFYAFILLCFLSAE